LSRKFTAVPSCCCLLLEYLIQSCARTREEPGTLTQGGALFSLVPLVWESNPKLQGEPLPNDVASTAPGFFETST
jgi:hypothetical protein